MALSSSSFFSIHRPTSFFKIRVWGPEFSSCLHENEWSNVECWDFPQLEGGDLVVQCPCEIDVNNMKLRNREHLRELQKKIHGITITQGAIVNPQLHPPYKPPLHLLIPTQRNPPHHLRTPQQTLSSLHRQK